MSKDLERQLDEMGPEYRAVVARLKAAETATPRKDVESRGGISTGEAAAKRSLEWCVSPAPEFESFAIGSRLLGLKSYLTAASLLVLVGLSALFVKSNNRTIRTIEQSNNSPRAPREYRLSVDEMIATQNADGSWANDFLTKRNAEALRQSGSPGARVAYKKALRNLRAKGL